MNRRSAVFLDLNGTLVEPVVVDCPDELTLIAGADFAVASLCRAGFVCPVVTVQSRIEKGSFSELDFREWFKCFSNVMAESGAILHGPYICPHRFPTDCPCAKPKLMLYEQAAIDLGIDLRSSFTVGDTPADVEAARRFGGRGCLVQSPQSGTAVASDTAAASFIGRTLQEIADWIIRQRAA